MDDPGDRIRVAIQSLLDGLGDGWTLTQHVLCLGLERVNDGRIESTAWYWVPAGQPEWMTDGLIEQAARLREDVDTDI